MFGGKRQSQGQSQDIIVLLGEGCELEGNFRIGDGMGRIDGTVKGSVVGSGGLIVGEKGLIKGDVSVSSLHLYGTIEGNVVCKELYIYSSGKMLGDVKTESISIEKGGRLNGKCIMEDRESL